MLVIKLKGPPNLGNLQGPYEAAIQNRRTWAMYANALDLMVRYFGPHTMPDDVIRSQVDEFKEMLAKKHHPKTAYLILSACRAFYTWMIYKGFATTNPFKTLQHAKYNDVQIIA